MDASTLTPDSPLPDDVGTLQRLVRQLLAEVAQLRAEVAQLRADNERLRADNDRLRAENDRLRAENEELKGKVQAALKHRFGRRSERRRPGPPGDKKPPRQCTPHGRAALPEHLERRDEVHDLTEAQKLCPCCGQPREYIGSRRPSSWTSSRPGSSSAGSSARRTPAGPATRTGCRRSSGSRRPARAR
jgi:regulator of replication initiation timing